MKKTVFFAFSALLFSAYLCAARAQGNIPGSSEIKAARFVTKVAPLMGHAVNCGLDAKKQSNYLTTIKKRVADLSSTTQEQKMTTALLNSMLRAEYSKKRYGMTPKKCHGSEKELARVIAKHSNNATRNSPVGEMTAAEKAAKDNFGKKYSLPEKAAERPGYNYSPDVPKDRQVSGRRMTAGNSHKELAPVIAKEMEKFAAQGKAPASPHDKKQNNGHNSHNNNAGTSYSYNYSYDSNSDGDFNFEAAKQVFGQMLKDKGGVEAFYALAVGFFGVFVVLFFLPTFLAFLRRSRLRWVIFLVNFFFGMSGIGWFVALIMALTTDKKDSIKKQPKWVGQYDDPMSRYGSAPDTRSPKPSPWGSSRNANGGAKSELEKINDMLEASPTHYESLENNTVIKDNKRSRDALAPSRLILMRGDSLAGKKACPRCGEMEGASRSRCTMCNYLFDD